MRTLVATDIHGIGPELRALLAPLQDAQFLSPWPQHDDACPHADEATAVRAFLAGEGLAGYARRIAEAAGGEPVRLLGFSVGASSAWLYAAQADCHPDSRMHLLYGSRIRELFQQHRPRCTVRALFAEHEAAFEPRTLVARLNELAPDLRVSAELLSGRAHGFMNPCHPAFDAGLSAALLHRWMSASADLS